MSAAPKPPAETKPPRDTIASLRAKLDEERSLRSYMFDCERQLQRDRDRLKRQSIAVAHILRRASLMRPDHHTVVLACAEILEANDVPFDDVPF